MRKRLTAPRLLLIPILALSLAAGSIADAFDRRIITLLAFGPAMTLVAMSLVFARNTVAMWGYPLWLFAGLWIVLHVRPLERVTMPCRSASVSLAKDTSNLSFKAIKRSIA